MGRVASRSPAGSGSPGVIMFLLIQVLSGGGGSAGGFDVDSPFGPAPTAPAADGGGIPAAQDPERDLKEFSAYVFSNTLDLWARLSGSRATAFQRAKVVLYRQAVSTGCGNASSAVGPFYCPADQRVYLDLSFYRDMETELGAPGDFAWAYVIAHEVGHHVQQQLGTSTEVSAAPARAARTRRTSCRCGSSSRPTATPACGPTASSPRATSRRATSSEAVRASAAVGDDRLQSRATGQVNPDSFTHGSSEQRTEWFNRGRASGEPADCDTFSPESV